VSWIRGAAATVTIGVALAVAAPSHAATTIGQILPGGAFGCGDGGFIVQTGVANGSDYRIPPGGGVITRWSAKPFSSGGADQILQLAVFGPDVSGNAVTFEALSAFERVIPVNPLLSQSFATRVPVDAGERIGLYARDTAGPEAFTWGCAVPSSGGNADRDIWGNLASPVIGGPPVVASNGQFLSQRVPVEAVLEPDADGDGFGDETQDQCPKEASTQGPCAVPETSINARPPKKTKSKLATFQFGSPTAGATFECQLDGGPFQPCSSPHLARVAKGKHNFAVRASAGGEIDASPATAKWKVKKKKRGR
jgi:hypothetical protein